MLGFLEQSVSGMPGTSTQLRLLRAQEKWGRGRGGKKTKSKILLMESPGVLVLMNLNSKTCPERLQWKEVFEEEDRHVKNFCHNPR